MSYFKGEKEFFPGIGQIQFDPCALSRRSWTTA